MKTKIYNKLSQLLFLLFIPFYAHAEYYLVYPAPAMSCIAPSCKANVHRVHRKIISHKKHHVKHVRQRNSYSISVYYPVVIPACACSIAASVPCCQYPFYPPHDSDGFNVFSTQTYEDNYNDDSDPDMSTGDDDASYHPDLQIND